MAVSFRVTERSVSTRTLDNLQLQLQKMQGLQDKLSSGKEVGRPSDNPSQAVQAMSYRSEQARNNQYTRNAQDGLGWLGTADGTLTSSLDNIQKVRELVLQGANGTTSTESRAALAEEVKTIKQALIGLSNTAYAGRPIFAGTASPQDQVPPVPTYDANGNYNGNDGEIVRTVGAGATVQVNVTGPSVYGPPGGENLWKVLDDIESHLRSTDPNEIAKLNNISTSGGSSILADVDRLDKVRQNVQNRLSEIGARYHRVETMQQRAEDNLLTIQSGLSEAEDVDLPKTIIAMQMQQVAYQSALSATSKVIQPSLVDFLK